LHPFRRRVRAAVDDMPEVEISEAGNIRSLHLGSETIQSSMDMDDPAELVLSYSRAMMAFLLWNDDPRHILQIGLGGGSFARFIDEYLPEAVSVAVDINPQVIAVARAFFKLPEEGDFFEIIEADGADYVKIFRGSTDAILVDGFDGLQIVDELTTEDSSKTASARSAPMACLSPTGGAATSAITALSSACCRCLKAACWNCPRPVMAMWRCWPSAKAPR
jgi:spermidine synthase